MTQVSVVIPSYNHAAYIGEAVTSVLTQTFSEIELLVVDDGSTDESLEVLSRFHDPRLRVICQSNQGTHAALNRGLAKAQGRFLAILNSDDAYTPNRLQTLTEGLANPRIGLIGSDIQVVDEQGRARGIKNAYHNLEPWALDAPDKSFRAGDDLRAALLTENYWATTSNYVFSREWYERVGAFRPLRYVHDWDFALRMARVAELAWVSEPLLRYRMHSHNTIRENRVAMIFEICWLLAVHLPNQTNDAWFGDVTSPLHVSRLLHSIYTFDCDRVLNVMLLERIAERPQVAEGLLDPQNPTRAVYLQYIKQQMARIAGTQDTRHAARVWQRLAALRMHR